VAILVKKEYQLMFLFLVLRQLILQKKALRHFAQWSVSIFIHTIKVCFKIIPQTVTTTNIGNFIRLTKLINAAQDITTLDTLTDQPNLDKESCFYRLPLSFGALKLNQIEIDA
jgi:hypothetical protein